MNFLYFYQSTALSSHAVDGHQMYSGGSVVGKASTIDPRDLAPPLSLKIGAREKLKLKFLRFLGF